MRIIRHSHSTGRITDWVKDDRARVNIRVSTSMQYTDGLDLTAGIDDMSTAIVHLRLDDLKEIVAFIQQRGTVRQRELLAAPAPDAPKPASVKADVEIHDWSAKAIESRARQAMEQEDGRLLPKMPLPDHVKKKEGQ